MSQAKPKPNNLLKLTPEQQAFFKQNMARWGGKKLETESEEEFGERIASRKLTLDSDQLGPLLGMNLPKTVTAEIILLNDQFETLKKGLIHFRVKDSRQISALKKAVDFHLAVVKRKAEAKISQAVNKSAPSAEPSSQASKSAATEAAAAPAPSSPAPKEVKQTSWLSRLFAGNTTVPKPSAAPAVKTSAGVAEIDSKSEPETVMVGTPIVTNSNLTDSDLSSSADTSFDSLSDMMEDGLLDAKRKQAYDFNVGLKQPELPKEEQDALDAIPDLPFLSIDEQLAELEEVQSASSNQSSSSVPSEPVSIPAPAVAEAVEPSSIESPASASSAATIPVSSSSAEPQPEPTLTHAPASAPAIAAAKLKSSALKSLLDDDEDAEYSQDVASATSSDSPQSVKDSKNEFSQTNLFDDEENSDDADLQDPEFSAKASAARAGKSRPVETPELSSPASAPAAIPEPSSSSPIQAPSASLFSQFTSWVSNFRGSSATPVRPISSVASDSADFAQPSSAAPAASSDSEPEDSKALDSSSQATSTSSLLSASPATQSDESDENPFGFLRDIEPQPQVPASSVSRFTSFLSRLGLSSTPKNRPVLEEQASSNLDLKHSAPGGLSTTLASEPEIQNLASNVVGSHASVAVLGSTDTEFAAPSAPPELAPASLWSLRSWLGLNSVPVDRKASVPSPRDSNGQETNARMPSVLSAPATTSLDSSNVVQPAASPASPPPQQRTDAPVTEAMPSSTRSSSVRAFLSSVFNTRSPSPAVTNNPSTTASTQPRPARASASSARPLRPSAGAPSAPGRAINVNGGATRQFGPAAAFTPGSAAPSNTIIFQAPSAAPSPQPSIYPGAVDSPSTTRVAAGTSPTITPNRRAATSASSRPAPHAAAASPQPTRRPVRGTQPLATTQPAAIAARPFLQPQVLNAANPAQAQALFNPTTLAPPQTRYVAQATIAPPMRFQGPPVALAGQPAPVATRTLQPQAPIAATPPPPINTVNRVAAASPPATNVAPVRAVRARAPAPTAPLASQPAPRAAGPFFVQPPQANTAAVTAAARAPAAVVVQNPHAPIQQQPQYFNNVAPPAPVRPGPQVLPPRVRVPQTNSQPLNDYRKTLVQKAQNERDERLIKEGGAITFAVIVSGVLSEGDVMTTLSVLAVSAIVFSMCQLFKEPSATEKQLAEFDKSVATTKGISGRPC